MTERGATSTVYAGNMTNFSSILIVTPSGTTNADTIDVSKIYPQMKTIRVVIANSSTGVPRTDWTYSGTVITIGTGASGDVVVVFGTD